jgi:hypothetical protein
MLNLVYCKSGDNVPNCLTKALPRLSFEKGLKGIKRLCSELKGNYALNVCERQGSVIVHDSCVIAFKRLCHSYAVGQGV